MINDDQNCCCQVRHGAATGLREIIKVHGKGAGKTVDTLSQDVSITLSQDVSTISKIRI